MDYFNLTLGVGLLFVGLYYLTEVLAYADEMMWSFDLLDWIGSGIFGFIGVVGTAGGLTIIARELLRSLPL